MPLVFLLYVNDMPQAVDWELLLYADKDKDITEVESALNKNVSILCGGL